MSDEKRKKGRPRKRGGYVPRSNAVHITLYDQSGKVLPQEVVDEALVLLGGYALSHNLLTSVART